MTSPSDTPAAPDVGELHQRLALLANDIEQYDLFGGTRSAEAATDIRSALASSAAETARLREERDEWKAEAARRFDRMREWMDASYHLKYAIDPAALEAAAEQIDCGGECETAWRDYDTNASGCTKSETDGCPFELASDLRAFAKAIRVHAGEADGIDWKARAQAAEIQVLDLQGQLNTAEAVAFQYQARQVAAEAENVKLREAWDWLAAHVNLELDWDEIEEGEAAWRIHRVSGSRNDRDWELIATGATPLEAVQSARATLKQPDSEEG